MAKKREPVYRIGTSGYQYDHWQPVFYPEGIPKKKWFDYYAEHFDTVEINNTFYNLPKEDTFDGWHHRAPNGFRYALKFSRYGTHMKKLKDPSETIWAFLERAERLLYRYPLWGDKHPDRGHIHPPYRPTSAWHLSTTSNPRTVLQHWGAWL